MIATGPQAISVHSVGLSPELQEAWTDSPGTELERCSQVLHPSPVQWPAYRPWPAKVEREITKGRVPRVFTRALSGVETESWAHLTQPGLQGSGARGPALEGTTVKEDRMDGEERPPPKYAWQSAPSQ